MFKAFDALHGDNPKTLILGTFPSIVSRAENEYYANPKNQFWRIIFNVFEESFDSPSYEKKREILIKNKLTLWDTVKSCEIEGSVDENIENAVYNDEIPEFINRYKIDKVLFNGKNAYNFYRRYIGKESLTNIENFILPSTSPANARMCFEQKLMVWREKLLYKNA